MAPSVQLRRGNCRDWRLPEAPDLVITNPPWGKRLGGPAARDEDGAEVWSAEDGADDSLEEAWTDLRVFLKEQCPGVPAAFASLPAHRSAWVPCLLVAVAVCPPAASLRSQVAVAVTACCAVLCRSPGMDSQRHKGSDPSAADEGHAPSPPIARRCRLPPPPLRNPPAPRCQRRLHRGTARGSAPAPRQSWRRLKLRQQAPRRCRARHHAGRTPATSLQSLHGRSPPCSIRCVQAGRVAAGKAHACAALGCVRPEPDTWSLHAGVHVCASTVAGTAAADSCEQASAAAMPQLTCCACADGLLHGDCLLVATACSLQPLCEMTGSTGDGSQV